MLNYKHIGWLILLFLLPVVTEAQVEPIRATVIRPNEVKIADPNAVRINQNMRNTRDLRARPNNGGNNGGNNGNTPKPADPDELEREGPANKPFDIANSIYSDYDFTGDRVLNVYNTVFRDNNIKSGYYYYLPASYSLTYSVTTKLYDFQSTYGKAEAGKPGKVTVTAILKPKLNKSDVQVTEAVLKKSLVGKPEKPYGVKELIAIPMAQAPEIVFTNLSQFGVTEADISLRAPSDLSDPIYLSFTTDRIEELTAMFFNNIGLYGDVIVYPDGVDMPTSIRIPFNLKIDSPETYGKFELQKGSWRSKKWVNYTDYPVTLTNFHVLRKLKSGSYKVFTWKTDNIKGASGCQRRFQCQYSSRLDRFRQFHQTYLDGLYHPPM